MTGVLASDMDLMRAMILVRAFEDHLLSLPRPGFQLLSSGEEAVAVGVCAALDAGDALLTSGRSIGPALARGIEPLALFAELLGKRSGPNQGKGGRGHLSQPSVGFFGAHAVVAGNLSVAAGVALADKELATGNVVACIFGDGACGAGALHETMNIAALWRLPLVLVCNNNQYSVSTHVRDAVAARRLADLATPFG
ncbi:MAG: thiamine pyrophosphate-dependent enzyme, partial [Polyangiaceae bacterium]